MHIVTTGDNAADITGTSGTIQKEPRQAVLFNAAIYEPDRTLTADKLTMLFEPDNTVQHALAEGNVNIEVRGPTIVDISGPRGDLNMGPQNAVQQAIVTGGAKYNTRGDNLSHGSADTFILDFEADNQPTCFHMVKNARMRQDPQPGKPGSPGPAHGNRRRPARLSCWRTATSSRPETPSARRRSRSFHRRPERRPPRPPRKPGQDLGSANATTVATAGKFHATFGEDNRMQTLHGSPDARIVSTSPGQPDKVSTSQNLDVTFAPDGGAEKLVQTGDFQYHEPSPKPDTGGRAMFADKATYTPADQMLVLNGSPRVIDGGMTTTADVIRLNRQVRRGLCRRQRQDHLQRSEAAARRSVAGDLRPGSRDRPAHDLAQAAGRRALHRQRAPVADRQRGARSHDRLRPAESHHRRARRHRTVGLQFVRAAGCRTASSRRSTSPPTS